MNATRSRRFTVVGLVPLILLATGCLATRKFVRNSQAPQDTRIQSTEQKTAQNAQAIKDLGEKTEAEISRAQSTADQGVQAAQQASQQAQAANQTAESGLASANQANSKITNLVDNLQNFQSAGHTVVTFGLNKSTLTKEDEQKLDEIVQATGSLKLYLIQVVGHTDNTGSKQYNLALSQRRADAVVRYLTEHHNVPVVLVHTVGYGEDIPIASNKTREGRGENRRVEITVLVPKIES
jgi:OOP family OmpA-OmpF porin